jgi:hypothetical protein
LRILVRIGERADDAYPVQLCLDDGSDPLWYEHPHTFGSIPALELDGGRISLADDSIEETAITAAGQALLDSLSSGDLAAAWAMGGEQVRHLMLEVRSPELRSLPWELLRDQQQRWLFSDRDQPAVRALLPFKVELPAMPVPVRLLVVLGDPQDGNLGADEEIDGIYDGLRRVPGGWQVEVLHGPRMEDLRTSFAEMAPHVLHFIGHGTTQGGQPALEVRNATGTWALTAGFIANALKGAPPPRLVVLNACRTSEGGPQELLWGVTDGFIGMGAASVVSMQGDIAPEPAVRFSTEFYRLLASGAPVDVAVAGARFEVQWTSGFHPRDWALPSLTVQAEPSTILRLRHPVDPDGLLAERDDLSDVCWMVNRSREHRSIWQRVAPDVGGAAAGANLLFVTGVPRVGKSALVRAWVLTCWLRQLPAVYTELPRKNIDWWEFLERIASAAADWLGPDVRTRSDAFVREMQTVLGQLSTPSPGAAAMRLPLAAFAAPAPFPRPLLLGDYVADVFNRFRTFATGLCGDEPLLLVVDGIQKVNQFDHIVQGLLRPAAAGLLRPIWLVIVEQQDLLKRMVPSDLLKDRRVQVPPFKKDSVVRLTREYYTRKRGEYLEVQENFPDRWELFIESMIDKATQRASGTGDTVFPGELIEWERSAGYDTGVLS